MNPVNVTRDTKETSITVQLGGQGSGIDVPVPLFAHFLTALTTTWGVDVSIKAAGDTEVDPHHLVEDVGIVLGRAVSEAYPGYRGIARYGYWILPMDEARVMVALDLSGRTGVWLRGFPEGPVAGLDGEVLAEFLSGFARGGGLTLHAEVQAGTNRHHQWEATFKALGLALRMATAPRGAGALSSKGVIG